MPQILHQCNKSVTTKLKKNLWANCYVYERYRGKTCSGVIFDPRIGLIPLIPSTTDEKIRIQGLL